MNGRGTEAGVSTVGTAVVVFDGPAASPGFLPEDSAVRTPPVTSLGGAGGKIALMRFRDGEGGQPVGFMKG